ncbi:MAG: LPS-assembly protein LptD [Terriglobia bacterium]
MKRRKRSTLGILAALLPFVLFLVAMPSAAADGKTSQPPESTATADLGCPVDTQQESERPAIPPELQNPQTTVTVNADQQQKLKDVYHLIGHAQVAYQDMKLVADEITYNSTTTDTVARGHVVLTNADAHLESDEAHYNVREHQGWFLNARGYVRAKAHPRGRTLTTENPFYLQASRVERFENDTYEVWKARLSTCEDQARGWSIATGRALIDPGVKAVSHDDVFRLLSVPVFYSPLLADSIARNPRQTGFLLPFVGNSTLKGYILGDGVFWAINPRVDVMLGGEDFSKRGIGGIGRFRARPSPTSDLTVDWYGIDDHGVIQNGSLTRAPGNDVRATGKAQDLGHGFRGVVDVDYLSSLAFRATFSDNFTEAVASEVHQTGFLTKTFDAYSLNLHASRYQDFLTANWVPNNSVSIRELPSVSFSGMDRQAGNSAFYFSFDLSATGVGRTEPDFKTPLISDRFDFHPEVLLRPPSFWGFHLSPTFSVRDTYYSTSLESNNESIHRVLGEVGLDLRPPSFEKVLNWSLWGRRLKHVIEPDIQYRLVRATAPETINDVIRFDEIDILAETDEIEYSLTNTLMARKDVPDGENAPQAQDFLSLRLSQKYYFNPTFGGALEPGNRIVFDPTISLTGFAFAQGRRLSPIVSVLKVAPFSNYDTEIRADLGPNGGGVLNAGITSHVKRGKMGLAFTDFYINRTEALIAPRSSPTSSAQLQAFHLLGGMFTYGDSNRKGLSGGFGVDFNIAQRIAQQVVAQGSYNFGCFALNGEYLRLTLPTFRQENSFRIALSLANVGTFGNLRPRALYNEPLNPTDNGHP